MNSGLLYAVLAFGLWGVFPLYFREVASVSPLEVVLHRSTWSLVFMALLLTVMRRWAWLPPLLKQPRVLKVFALSAGLVACNWFVYVYSVQVGAVVEASLGYFINPLFNVLLGVFVLHERLRRIQWAAVALAAAGVLWLTWWAGRPPWIALVLAGSFGLYGLIRKTAPLGALEGLMLETLLMAPVVVPWLVWWSVWADGALSKGDLVINAWLVMAGPLTALPLLAFAAAARRLKLATLGLVQYLGPTLQLVLGVWVFHEAFDLQRLLGFVLIWAALALYSGEALWRSRQEAGVQG
jgi:chloramphenicol-sensitive protein RarD